MASNIFNIIHRDSRTRGVVAIIIAVLLLSFSDAVVKLAQDRFGLGQIVLLRSLVAAGLLAGWLLTMVGPHALRLVRPGWVWTRSLCMAAMWLCYYSALPTMSFSLAAACYYMSPVWMALIGRIFLGTQIGQRGWVAIILCVTGVVLAVNPGAETLSPNLLLPLAAGVFYAVAGIITSHRCQAESAGAMALNLNLCLCGVAVIGLVGLAVILPSADRGFTLTIWPSLRLADWALVVFLGGLLAIITVAVASAYRLAPTPVVGVFDTAYLGFAALWGSIFFADIPTAQEAVGLGVIAVAAILMSTRRPTRHYTVIPTTSLHTFPAAFGARYPNPQTYVVGARGA